MAEHVFTRHGTTFLWDENKAAQNLRKHGVAFAEAATVFDDPLFVLLDASRNEERRDAVIGFSAHGRLVTVVHIEVNDDSIRIVSARRASATEEMIYAQ